MTTLAVAAEVAGIASAAVGAAGAISSAQSQKNAANYNAQVAQQNAIMAQQQGQANAELLQRQQQQKVGAALAQYGASGVEVSGGTPFDVLADSTHQAVLDLQTAKYNASIGVTNYQTQANLDQANAANAMTAGYFNATSAALSGVSNVAFQQARIGMASGGAGSGQGVAVPEAVQTSSSDPIANYGTYSTRSQILGLF